MAYTFLSASLTNTYLAPCSLTHLVVHSAALALAPLTPHWLSEIQPVMLPSAAMVKAAANKVAAVMLAKRTFISPSRNCLFKLLRTDKSGETQVRNPERVKTPPKAGASLA